MAGGNRRHQGRKNWQAMPATAGQGSSPDRPNHRPYRFNLPASTYLRTEMKPGPPIIAGDFS
jgi:hypothetical protein